MNFCHIFYENEKIYNFLFYPLGAASTARALSAYFDSLINFAMKDYFVLNFPFHSEVFASYADLFAMMLCLILTSKFQSKYNQ